MSCKRSVKWITIGLLSISIVAWIALIPLGNCQQDSPDLKDIKIVIGINIKEIDPIQHRVRADALVGISNVPTGTKYIALKFYDLESTILNCTDDSKYDWTQFVFTNNTYNLQGKAENKYWDLDGHGEAYPFDYYKTYFVVSNYYVEYGVNGTQYISKDFNVFLNPYLTTYSAAPVDRDVLSAWDFGRPSFDHQYSEAVFFSRKESISQWIILIPLFSLLLVVVATALSSSKNNKLAIYSSILVFAPLFTFAIENQLPSRSTLALPEFLSTVLIMTSASMILVLVIRTENRRNECFFEIVALSAMLVFSFVAPIYYLYADLMDNPSVYYTISFLTILFITGILVRFLTYRHKSLQAARRFDIV